MHGSTLIDGVVRMATDDVDRLTTLQGSARGWHGVQLAVLGFIGLCGVLQRDPGGRPGWLQLVAGLLVLLALVLSCVATALVASVAWPVYGFGGGQQPEGAGRRLRTGIVLTYVAVAVLAVATSSAWWPADSSDRPGLVEVSSAGGTACGQVLGAQGGRLLLDTEGGRVLLNLADVTGLTVVTDCP